MMPITWTVDSAERFLVLTVTDPYTTEEWTSAVLTVLHNAVFRQRRAILVDRRGAEAPTPAFVGTVVQFMAAHADALAHRTAVIVGDAAGFGMARMTALRAEFDTPAATIRPFYDYDQAVRWLTAPQSTAA
jgi:hypothetical protein